MYMSKIKTFVNALPNATFSITTNGVDIDNYIDFFTKHNFVIVTSYDGLDSNRPVDTLAKDWPVRPIRISATIYKQNLNLSKLYQGLVTKEDMLGCRIYSYPHISHCLETLNPKFNLTQEDVDNYTNQIVAIIDKFFDDLAIGVVNVRYRSIIRAFTFDRNFEFGETYCVGKSYSKCDCSGQCYTCLYKRDEPIDRWEDQKEIIRKKFPECEDCEFYYLCGAACIQSSTHSSECKFYKTIYKLILERMQELGLTIESFCLL